MNEKLNSPFFSIIVPVYKTEEYIHQCVESILHQTYADFEAILVDDGSPDSCPEICDEYAKKDSRIRVVHKQNGGLVSARKAGLSESRGEYIINVDSDDYVSADLLEKVYSVIKKYNPQVVMYDLMQFSADYSSPLKNRVPEGLYQGDDIALIHKNLINNERAEQIILYNLCSMCIKKEKYLSFQNSVPAGVSMGEDLAVSAPLLAETDSVYVLEHFGYYYRTNPNSIMNTFNKNEISQIKLLVKYLSGSLDASYEARLNIYTLTHYFSFIDRAIARYSFKEYRRLIRETFDDELFSRIKRAGTNGSFKTKVLFSLVKNKMFLVLWILRKIQRPYK